MQHLNYHHLLYFWTVAKYGSITAATKKLKLAQPTISGQIRQLEESIGEKLFDKRGRGLQLSERGKIIFKYAEKIFSAGAELHNFLTDSTLELQLRFRIGIAMVIPKLVTYKFLKVIMGNDFIPVCTEDTLENLLAKLSLGDLDVVFSDSPIPPMVNVKAYNHLLIDCPVTFCASPTLSKKYQKNFPQSLEQAPFLLPTEGTSLRRLLSQWFEKNKITPKIIAEFNDSALLKVFAEHGHGIFAIPSIIEKEVEKQYNVKIIGKAKSIKETFYAISVEKNIRHTALKMITEQV